MTEWEMFTHLQLSAPVRVLEGKALQQTEVLLKKFAFHVKRNIKSNDNQFFGEHWTASLNLVFFCITCRKEILSMPLQGTETSLTRRFCRSWWNTRSSSRRRTATSVSSRITLTICWYEWWRKPPVFSECHMNLLGKLANFPKAEMVALEGTFCWIHEWKEITL